jgi:hypothetical protein
MPLDMQGICLQITSTKRICKENISIRTYHHGKTHEKFRWNNSKVLKSKREKDSVYKSSFYKRLNKTVLAITP